MTRWPKRSASDTKSPSGSMTVCCTQGTLCSSSRRSKWDLPEPELPCTSRRVASSSSRSMEAESPVAVRPISIATVIFRLKPHFEDTHLSIRTHPVERSDWGNSGKWITGETVKKEPPSLKGGSKFLSWSGQPPAARSSLRSYQRPHGNSRLDSKVRARGINRFLHTKLVMD